MTQIGYNYDSTIYYRARYYDPTIGRFISEDPTQFAGSGTNFYAYVDNDPVNLTDPLGLCDNKSPNNSSRVNQATQSAIHTFVAGEVIGAGVGCGVGVLVAAGATVATDTYPLAGATLPAGCIGGGMKYGDRNTGTDGTFSMIHITDQSQTHFVAGRVAGGPHLKSPG